MGSPGSPTLDQLKVFLAVVDTGGFTAAARKLGRATSVVSYAIHNLEQQLGSSLFERDASRRLVLTVAGSTFLPEARVVSNGINRMRAKAEGLLSGLESQLTLALDVMLPESRVVDALQAFHEAYPAIPLRIRAEALGAVTQNVLDGSATLGVRGPPDVEIDGLERIGVGSVDLIPVAAPGHPLAQADDHPVGAGRAHMQIVLTDRSSLTEGQDLGVVATHTWRVADLTMKQMLLRAGLGWGAMPAPLIRDDLEAGRLVHLNLPDFKGGAYRFFAIHRTDTPLGPAAAFLVRRLAEQVPAWDALSNDVRAL